MTPQVATKTEEEVTRIEHSAPQKVVRTTTKVVPPPIAEESPQKAYNTKKVIFRTYQIAWYILGIVEILLGFRLLLKLVGANPASGFANFVYTLSDPFAKPFLGVVGVSISDSSVLEWPTFLAMAFYAVVVWLIIEFFQLVKPVNRDEVEQTV